MKKGTTKSNSTLLVLSIYPCTLLLNKLQGLEILSPQEFVKIAYNNFGYFGEEYYIENQEVYKEVITRFEKDSETDEKDLLPYGKGLAKYILNTYRFKGGRIIAGRLLFYTAQYYPKEISKIAYTLLDEKNTS